MMTVDAVVIGAGPNGLVAANDLADHGWDVLVLEAQPEPGGAVRSGEILERGFITDRFSAFYPLGIVSPHFRRLQLDRWGLEWVHAPAVLAHPTIDGPTAILSRDLAVTAATLDLFHTGDGDAWLELQREWDTVEDNLVAALMRPFPPIRAGLGLARTLGVHDLAALARRALLPVRRFADEHFAGPGGGLLLAGSALHADLTPESAMGGFFGWLLAAIGQAHGWPVPRGGAAAITNALVRRLSATGGELRCNTRVVHIDVARGRAVAVRTADGERIEARHAILADVVAPVLYGDLLDADDVAATTRADMRHYERGAATFKLNWTLDGTIPWADPVVRESGTVHLAPSIDELTTTSAQLAMGLLPEHPFVLVGQMTTADPTRSPPGTETVWAYTNIPQHIRGDAANQLHGVDTPSDAKHFADRIQQRLETFAPGFTSHIRQRSIQNPHSFETDDANLLRGDKSLGSAQLHQELIFRPTIGLGRSGTHIAGLFLASASAHPGGGVHGACGANAARAAIIADQMRRLQAPIRLVRRR